MSNAALGMAALFIFALTVPNSHGQSTQAHIDWIAESLMEMQEIEIGMTRARLLEVFETEGGISTGLHRTYVYRECPYIKVDVEFEPVGRSMRDANGRITLVESHEDVVIRISKPYLEWSILD